MSRIGKLPIEIPAGVEVKITDNHEVVAKGPRGELTQSFDRDLSVKIEDNILTVERPTEQKRHKALHGLFRSLINNIIIGVTTGYEKRLVLSGVGYRAIAKGQVLELNVGYSHPVMIALPPEVKLETEIAKGKEPVIILKSNDKQLIGQMAAKIRSVRKPEPYKGKGIRYSDEVVRRKAGKSAAK